MNFRHHYQDDGLEDVNHFSRPNILLTAFMIAIIGVIVADIWLTPTWQEVVIDQDAAIPWSPHPKP